MKLQWKLQWKRALALVLAAVAACGIGAALADNIALAATLESTASAAPLAVSYSRVASLSVYVDGTLSGDLSMNSVVCGEVVKLTARATANSKNFTCWAFDSEGKEVASTQSTYWLAVNSDTKLYAVYGGSVESSPKIAFSSVTKEDYNDGEYIRMTATYSLAALSSLPPPSASDTAKGEVGVRYTSNNLLGVGGTADLIASPEDGINVTELLTSGKLEKGVHASVGEYKYDAGDWTLSLSDPGTGVHVYAVAYITVNGTTYYSDVKNVVIDSLTAGSILDANVSEPFIFD